MIDKNRVIYLESSTNISESTVKRIVAMEDIAHKEKMVLMDSAINYSDLAECYGVPFETLNVIVGNDWYIIYVEDQKRIEIADLARTEPNIPFENMQQISEINLAFNFILRKSIVLNQANGIDRVKVIEANLREDTSYPLFLMEIKKGKIMLIGKDKLNYFNYGYCIRTFSPEEQQQILENIKSIKAEGNPDLRMHHVEFVPTQKEIMKLIDTDFSIIEQRASSTDSIEPQVSGLN